MQRNFGRNGVNKIHLKSCLKNDRYHCPNQCGRNYKYINGLSQHLKNECGVLPRFKCTTCTKQFYHNHVLKIHMATVHSII